MSQKEFLRSCVPTIPSARGNAEGPSAFPSEANTVLFEDSAWDPFRLWSQHGRDPSTQTHPRTNLIMDFWYYYVLFQQLHLIFLRDFLLSSTQRQTVTLPKSRCLAPGKQTTRIPTVMTVPHPPPTAIYFIHIKSQFFLVDDPPPRPHAPEDTISESVKARNRKRAPPQNKEPPK